MVVVIRWLATRQGYQMGFAAPIQLAPGSRSWVVVQGFRQPALDKAFPRPFDGSEARFQGGDDLLIRLAFIRLQQDPRARHLARGHLAFAR